MDWTAAVRALAAVTIISVIAGFVGRRKGEYRGPLSDYLLASQGLESRSVVQLLLSGSFSLNGMLYQVWLGYTIGLWALVVQGAWALGYVLLGPFSSSILESKSLHSFLANRFGEKTRVLAGLCSIIGFTILVGWEFNVGLTTFEGLFTIHGQPPARTATFIFTVAVVFASFLYTAMGGLRGDAFANFIQNVIKGSVFGLMIALLVVVARTLPVNGELKTAFFPSFSQVIANLTWFGLITNIAFSLIWQFVDMSTWQSIIASAHKSNEHKSRRDLQRGGFAVFMAPGVVGTILGVFLVGLKDVNADNVMTRLVSILPYQNPTLLFLVFAAILASMMSTIDIVLLASAYSFVLDVAYRAKSLTEIDKDDELARKLLGYVRLLLGVLAFVGTLGVYVLVNSYNVSLFNVVYVLVICQLALTGPVVVGFQKAKRAGDGMVWSIIVGLCVGFGSTLGSRLFHQEWLLTGAGCFTMLASYLVAESMVDRRVKAP
jgi:Na+/proline symporter